jgi:hypothetical protein
MTTSQHLMGHDRCSQNEALLRKNKGNLETELPSPGRIIVALNIAKRLSAPPKKPPIRITPGSHSDNNHQKRGGARAYNDTFFAKPQVTTPWTHDC